MFLKSLLVGLLLLGLFFALFGVYFIALGSEARSWPQTAGTIQSVTVRTSVLMSGGAAMTPEQRERRRQYYPQISYRWEVGGQSYTGSRFRLGTTHEKYNQREKAVAAASRYKNGASIDVYYDPSDPSQAVLLKAASGGVFVPLPLGLLFAAAGWLGLRKIDLLRNAVASGGPESIDIDIQ